MDWINIVVELIFGLLGKRWRTAVSANLGIVARILGTFHFGAGMGLAVSIICVGLEVSWERSFQRD